MTTFAIERQSQPLNYFECPRWADILARSWLILLAAIGWLATNQPRAEVYVLSRADLALKHLGPFPPAHWRLGAVFAAAAVVVLWQDMIYSLFVKGVAVCVS